MSEMLQKCFEFYVKREKELDLEGIAKKRQKI
jgi:hypothetical protein